MKATLLVSAFAAVALFGAGAAGAASTATKAIDKEVQAALATLYETTPEAKALGAKARGILVFPTVRRAGLIVGGQRGEGAMLKKRKISDYYTTTAISFGLEAGAQSYSFALFFMSDDALRSFEKSDGFEIGAGANVVFVDAGAAAGASTATSPAGIYGFVYGQQGLMGGVSMQGTKITKVKQDAR